MRLKVDVCSKGEKAYGRVIYSPDELRQKLRPRRDEEVGILPFFTSPGDFERRPGTVIRPIRCRGEGSGVRIHGFENVG